jgi:hypothetical protein
MTPLAVLASSAALTIAVGGLLCLRRGLLVMGVTLQIVGAAVLGVMGTLVFFGAPAQGAAFGSTAGMGMGIDRLTASSLPLWP